MRINEISEILSEGIEDLKLSVDNPGGRWLDSKRKSSEEAGTNQFGMLKIMGTVTGVYNRPAFMPVNVLRKIRGAQGEQDRVRYDDLESIKQYMSKEGKLPPSDHEPSKEYVPFIMVDQRGKAFVNEGNHRIMAADSLGFQVLPVEIRYYNGGEQEPGVFSTENVKMTDQSIIDRGYGFGRYKLL